MVTPDEARAMAVAFPGVGERSHHNTADFRVRGKIFATLPDDERMVVRIDPSEQHAILESFPTTFSPAAGAWGERGWTVVRLALVDPDMLHDLLIDGWRRLAGKRAVEAFDLERRAP
ncbi:MAG: MmcQ/YjbR family DNA-binding protein [Chloroflexota bacterium]